MATLNIEHFPDALYATLGELARRKHRSIPEQVIHLLRQAMAAEPSLSLLNLRGLGRKVWRDTDAAAYVAEERDSWNP